MVKVIVGLGNPGDKYKGTRHNIGFDVVDKLAEYFNLSWQNKYNAEFAEYNYNGGKIYFLKPLTFMNLSGDSVAQLANFYKMKPKEIFVIHDEMNIDYGKIKIRRNGSSGGHNGLKSVIERLGSQDYPRLKMGIGRDASKDVVSYVLGKFTPTEKETYDDFIEKGMKATLSVLEHGLDKSMSEYNQ